ncbi:MAG: SPASM domain-containing protein [Clostridia bacterium]|nr:SPASM domain-containing protein [Clostridia bacterium]
MIFIITNTKEVYNQKWTNEDLINLKDNIHALGNIYAKEIIETKTIGFDFFDKQIKRNILNSPSTGSICTAGKNTITILPTGKLIACGDFSGLICSEIEIGHLSSGADINKINKFLSKCSHESFFSNCKNCKLLNKCANYCPSRNFYSHGKLFEISIVECSISKIMIEEADFIINKISLLGEDFFLRNFFAV